MTLNEAISESSVVRNVYRYRDDTTFCFEYMCNLLFYLMFRNYG